MIAIGSAVYTIGNMLSDVVADAIGNDGLALIVVNATNKTTLRLVHQSGAGDKNRCGDWAGDKHPLIVVKPKQDSSFSSHKRNKETEGNTNGVVFAAIKDDKTIAYLRICWNVPIFGKATYQIEWSPTWNETTDRNTLLSSVASFKPGAKAKKIKAAQEKDTQAVSKAVAAKEEEEILLAADGLQRVEFSKELAATGTFGTAPLKVVVHDYLAPA